MWIFCGGMPRAGSTLQFQLTAHLVERAGLGGRVEWVRPDEFSGLRQADASRAGWKVLKTHVCTPEIVAEFNLGNAKGVYVFRDVRDVVVSRMRKTDVPFERVWAGRFLDRVFTGFERWTSLEGVLVSKYEDVVADVAGEVGRIAAHLGIALSRTDCEEVASGYTLVRQRERIRQAEAAGRLRQVPGRQVQYDPESNLHVDHIGPGVIGGWKTVLARTEVAMVEDRARDWLVANHYPLSLPAWRRVLLKLQYTRRRAGDARR